MQIGTLDARMFLDFDIDGSNTPLPPPKNERAADAKFKLEHLNYFSGFSFDWPVDWSVQNTVNTNFNGWTQRQAEVIWLCHKLFPVRAVFEGDHLVEYLDAGKSLTVLFGSRCNVSLKEALEKKSYTGPWREHCCTLTSVTRIGIRVAAKVAAPDGSSHIVVKVRMMLGKEALAMIGWDPSYWQAGQPAEDVCWSLAGNAMSAMVLIPHVFAGIAVLGSECRRDPDPECVEVSTSDASSDATG